MTKLQFRVLYREFLFRMVDLELLSAYAEGDMRKLYGQFVSLFLFLSLALGVVGLQFGTTARRMPPALRVLFAWGSEHFLIATTMLTVGLLAVLSWDSTFPDRRDVLVLAPLPVRARTMFFAKVAALASALGAAVGTLHVFAGVVWPLVLSSLPGGPGMLRTFAAWWVTMLAAGAFVLCSMLSVQGLAAQLPRRYFLLVSAFLQMGAFCLLVSVYFLQPGLPSAEAITRHFATFGRLPSYWFFGLFHSLSGSPVPQMAVLAGRAWMGLAITAAGAGTVFLLSYLRTLRRIVEEPDIVPGARGVNWLPRFGGTLATAVVHFSLRTLLRSRLHRVILAFYAGIGFALTIWFLKTPMAQNIRARGGGNFWHEVSTPMLASTLLMLGFWVAGARVVFSMPLDLRANWIFRVTPVRGGSECLAARRRALQIIGVLPVWVGTAAVLVWLWPASSAIWHLLVLGLAGAILVEVSLGGVQKIPFTCSYLPGRSNLHMTFWCSILLVLTVVIRSAETERLLLRDVRHIGALVLGLGMAAAALRWRSARLVSEGGVVEFEAQPADRVLVLGISEGGPAR